MRVLIFMKIAALLIFTSSVMCKSPMPVSSPEISVNRAKFILKEIIDLPGYRNYKNPEVLNLTAQYIKSVLSKSGYDVIEQKFTVRGTEYKNLRVFYGDKNFPRLVVGAHYDVHGDQQGADDNGSAVTGLILLSELLQQNKPEIPYHIEMVFYTLEEPPFFRSEFMGSYIHAKSIHDEKINLIGMICLEMIGFYSEDPHSQNYPAGILKWFYPDKGNFIGVVGNFTSSSLVNHFAAKMKLADIPVEKLKAPSFLTGVDFSDHLNYWKFGYKALMITDTSFYRNPNYHEPTDTIETINFIKLTETIKGVYLALISLK